MLYAIRLHTDNPPVLVSLCHLSNVHLGATAALKGGSGLSGFAMSKFSIRAMAQSLAREFGPKGIHVSHAIIDGIIDTEKTKGFMEDIPDSKIDPNWVRTSLISDTVACGSSDEF